MATKILTSIFVLLLLFTSTINASWWLLAMPSAYEMTLQMKENFDYKDQCLRMSYLVERQRELCTTSENLLMVVSQGAQLGVHECQRQFAGRHWNCSTPLTELQPYLIKNSESEFAKKLRDQPMQDNRSAKPSRGGHELKRDLLKLGFQSDAPAEDVGDVFGEVLKLNTREKAFMHAVSAAGVAYSITQACRRGKLASCACDINVHLNTRLKEKHNGNWEWGGCSDDVSFGQQLSKDFIDANDLAKVDGDPAPTLMNLHNNDAGRKALRQNMKLICKCHGVSGSCTTKICWRQMADFDRIGKSLYRKFDKAVLVKFNMQKHRLKPVAKGRSQPRKRDLVYLEESPNYCESNSKYGIPGTQGRECKVDSFGVDNCKVLCCGRGHDTIVTETVRECHCNFVWCCQVQCKTCVDKTEHHYCR